ncbi:kinetochore protein Sim4 [Schizosaccharomyces cryophilus OY26]|uniref:Kinetochore protein Sim4 n=1 Tax=Schizosaccharomyces cryophilus (strain OY26 / ATCC MYA-4695 / CBS 11777 / NBRC 106824 / NRRL Y48691) TaxID=653667 RepID=S9VTW9_SCHCR|nr:kinetochore protein Sim4 [Schizosaccharomyces cryophilus OY26]EPY49619.1 kinetochore protein Sim4 [Schizosaccharomyces cryophilus OY26]
MDSKTIENSSKESSSKILSSHNEASFDFLQSGTSTEYELRSVIFKCLKRVGESHQSDPTISQDYQNLYRECVQDYLHLKKHPALASILRRRTLEDNVKDLEQKLESSKKVKYLLDEEYHQVRQYRVDMETLNTELSERLKQQDTISRKGKKSFLNKKLIQEKEDVSRSSMELFTFLNEFLDKHYKEILEGPGPIGKLSANERKQRATIDKFANSNQLEEMEELKRVLEELMNQAVSSNPSFTRVTNERILNFLLRSSLCTFDPRDPSLLKFIPFADEF